MRLKTLCPPISLHASDHDCPRIALVNNIKNTVYLKPFTVFIAHCWWVCGQCLRWYSFSLNTVSEILWVRMAFEWINSNQSVTYLLPAYVSPQYSLYVTITIPSYIYLLLYFNLLHFYSWKSFLSLPDFAQNAIEWLNSSSSSRVLILELKRCAKNLATTAWSPPADGASVDRRTLAVLAEAGWRELVEEGFFVKFSCIFLFCSWWSKLVE